jgi:hypothetical protein
MLPTVIMCRKPVMGFYDVGAVKFHSKKNKWDSERLVCALVVGPLLIIAEYRAKTK